jgi:hypothetical protein
VLPPPRPRQASSAPGRASEGVRTLNACADFHSHIMDWLPRLIEKLLAEKAARLKKQLHRSTGSLKQARDRPSFFNPLGLRTRGPRSTSVSAAGGYRGDPRAAGSHRV